MGVNTSLLLSVDDPEFVPTKEQIEKIIEIMEKHDFIQFKPNVKWDGKDINDRWDDKETIKKKLEQYKEEEELEINLPKMVKVFDDLYGPKYIDNGISFKDQPTPGLAVTDYGVYSLFSDYWEEGEPDTRFVIIWQGMYRGNYAPYDLDGVIKEFPIRYKDFITEIEEFLDRKLFFNALLQ